MPHPLLTGKPGTNATFSDSEMLTLILAQDFIPYGETQYIAFLRANLRHLFPQFLDQSQFNRRARGLLNLLEWLRREWVVSLTGGEVKQVLLDTKPIPVLGNQRSKRHSDLAGSAAYGYCAARNLNCFGYKLVLLTDLTGLPLVYDLVPANTDERQAAKRVSTTAHGPYERPDLRDAGGWNSLAIPSWYGEAAKISNEGVNLGDEK